MAPPKKPPPDWLVDPAWPAVPDPAEPPPPDGDKRSALRRRVDARLQRARQAPAEPAQRRRGNPGHPARNDRLLALYEATPEHLPKLQRCRIAAARYAAEHDQARSIPATTARDAINEARKRRQGE